MERRGDLLEHDEAVEKIERLTQRDDKNRGHAPDLKVALFFQSRAFPTELAGLWSTIDSEAPTTPISRERG